MLEAHVGTFTQQATYRAMIDKLDHLVATGITALELMPLADFAGRCEADTQRKKNQRGDDISEHASEHLVRQFHRARRARADPGKLRRRLR